MITFCSFEKNKISKNLILSKLLFFQKERERERERESHFKKFIVQKKFQNFVRTTSGLNPLSERYVGSLFKGPIAITQKETSFQKRRYFKTSFLKTFFELHLDLILYERGTQATFSKARSQSLKKKLHFKNHFFQNFFLNYIQT